MIIIINLGFPDSSVGKACNAGDPSSIPGLGRFTGEGIGYTLQYSGLENAMECIVHGVAKSRTRLRNLTFSLQQTPTSVIDPINTPELK